MSALFFVLAAGLVALALALIAPPLFWPPRGTAAEGGGDEESRRRENIAAARRRMRELRARRGAREISEEDFSESRAEIEWALLDDLAAESESRVGKMTRGRGDLEGGRLLRRIRWEGLWLGGFGGIWTAVILCAALPVAAGGLYLHLGSPQAISGAASIAGAGRGRRRWIRQLRRCGVGWRRIRRIRRGGFYWRGVWRLSVVLRRRRRRIRGRGLWLGRMRIFWRGRRGRGRRLRAVLRGRCGICWGGRWRRTGGMRWRCGFRAWLRRGGGSIGRRRIFGVGRCRGWGMRRKRSSCGG